MVKLFILLESCITLMRLLLQKYHVVSSKNTIFFRTVSSKAKCFVFVCNLIWLLNLYNFLLFWMNYWMQAAETKSIRTRVYKRWHLHFGVGPKPGPYTWGALKLLLNEIQQVVSVLNLNNFSNVKSVHIWHNLQC